MARLLFGSAWSAGIWAAGEKSLGDGAEAMKGYNGGKDGWGLARRSSAWRLIRRLMRRASASSFASRG